MDNLKTSWRPLCYHCGTSFGPVGNRTGFTCRHLGATRDHLGATGSPLGYLFEVNWAIYHLEPHHYLRPLWWPFGTNWGPLGWQLETTWKTSTRSHRDRAEPFGLFFVLAICDLLLFIFSIFSVCQTWGLAFECDFVGRAAISGKRSIILCWATIQD